MTLFSSFRQRWGAFLSPRKISQNKGRISIHKDQASDDQSSLPDTNRQSLESERRESTDSGEFEGQKLQVNSGREQKRRTAASSAQGPTKRRKTNHSNRKDVDDDGEYGRSMLSTFEPETKARLTPVKSKADADRQLMPPPATPNSAYQRRRGSMQSGTENEDEYSEISSVASGGANKRRVEAIEEFNMELISPKAGVIPLPPNSGLWAEAEHHLFQRLQMRGYEPLLPENWMVDFKTLPLSLYAREGTPESLITPNNEAEFRAIRALRDIIALGGKVRDRGFCVPKPRPEPFMKREIKRYLAWALRDVGMHRSQRPNAIPVYAINALRRNQTTQDALQELAADLHVVAARWRRANNIRESVETHEITPSTNDDTQLAGTNSDDLPVLTGILICSFMVVIVTLDAHALPPASLMPKRRNNPGLKSAHPLPQSSDVVQVLFKSDQDLLNVTEPSTGGEDEARDSSLRMIATFDFSDARQDVWNALAVAIVAICIRKTMLSQFEFASRTGDRTMWELVDPKSPPQRGRAGDDPDA